MTKIEFKKPNYKLSLKKRGVPGYFLSSHDQVLIRRYRETILNFLFLTRNFRSSGNKNRFKAIKAILFMCMARYREL